MNYAEASFFDGAHFAHIAAWLDAKRLERLERVTINNRRRGR